MAEPSMPPTLAELAEEIFLLVLSFRKAPHSVDFDVFSGGAQALFGEFDRRARASKIDPAAVEAAKYALAAFVDEAVLRSQWPGRERWADNPLQLQLFETYLAGEGFFERLDSLRAGGEAAAETVEVYCLCLLLGFEGKYGVGGAEPLRALAAGLRDELNRFRPQAPDDMSSHWRIKDGPRPESNRLPRWLIYACASVAAACLLLYLAFFIDIRSSAGQLQNERGTAVLLRVDELPGSRTC